MSCVDWSSVVPALITGAVGVVGVGGTLLSARISAKSTVDRDQLAEKRRAYAAVYASNVQLNEALASLHREARQNPGNQDIQQKAQERIENEFVNLSRAVSELVLVAPQGVAVQANEVFVAYSRLVSTYRQGDTAVHPNNMQDVQDLRLRTCGCDA